MSKARDGLTPDSRISPCCNARLMFEMIGSMRVYRVTNNRRIYKARCEKCGASYSINGGGV